MMNGVGKPCAGEPHARFDRGPLGRLTPRRDGTHAPNGKPTGLSPSAAPATPNQRPTSPVTQFSKSLLIPSNRFAKIGPVDGNVTSLSSSACATRTAADSLVLFGLILKAYIVASSA
jgi:hypothetical protein